jgi:phosphotransferase system HPr-like phosphotransfer protein
MNHALILFHQEMYIRDLNIEFENSNQQRVSTQLKLPQRLHTKIGLTSNRSMSVSQKSLSSLLSSGRAQKEKLEMENEKRLKAREAFEEYHKQGEPRKVTTRPT